MKIRIICGIYKVINLLNGKIYIGHSIDVKRRWSDHRRGKGNLLLKRAIEKYGINNFKFELIEEIDKIDKTNDEIIQILYEREQYWFDIEKPYLRKNGYNLNKIAKPNLSGKIKIENNYFGKPILQYDLKGNLVKEWQSARRAEMESGFSRKMISTVCSQNGQHTGEGFIWRFKTNPLSKEELKNILNRMKYSQIRQYTLNGNLVREYKDSKEASKLTGINSQLILHACEDICKTTGGFIWKNRNKKLILSEHRNKQNRQILQYSLDGKLIKVWKNMKNILETLKIDIKAVRKCCKYERKEFKEYIWRYKYGNDKKR